LKKPTFFVAPDKTKRRNKTESILSRMGLALVGWKVGDVNWNFKKEKNNWKSWPLKDAVRK
jgi:regulator of nucleoside diphosphate kinase